MDRTGVGVVEEGEGCLKVQLTGVLTGQMGVTGGGVNLPGILSNVAVGMA